MALSRAAKATQLQKLAEQWTKATSVLFAQYSGLTVRDISTLRRKLKEQGAEMKVAKKTLLRIAAKEAKAPYPDESALPGAIACIFSFSDPLVGAQVTLAFRKDHPCVTFLGSIFDGKILSSAEALSLAQIPNRPILLATFASMLRAPLQQFASLCNSPLISFSTSLHELAKKKELQ